MITNTLEKKIRFNNGEIPDNFHDLCKICHIGPIQDENNYEIAMRISGELMLLNVKNKEQLDYLDKLTDYIVDYEDENFDF